MSKRYCLDGLLKIHCWLALLAVVGGCSDRLKCYPAKGVVVFPSGSTAHVGTVELKSREHGVQARGEIQQDGTFTLTTYVPNDGAVAGIHDCVVVQFVMTEDIKNLTTSALGVVHPRFGSYSTSGLVVEVKPDAPNDFKLQVEGVKKISPKEEAAHDPSKHHK